MTYLATGVAWGDLKERGARGTTPGFLHAAATRPISDAAAQTKHSDRDRTPWRQFSASAPAAAGR
eukprot:5565191-Heterocapsa_arctica.AAC.1